MKPAELQRRRARVERVNAKRPPAPGIDVSYVRNDNRLEDAAAVFAQVLQELLDDKARRDRP